MKKIFLCHAPIDKSYLDATTHFAPSLGIMSLKTYIEQNSKNQVYFLDGSFEDLGALLSKIESEKPDFVGVSDQMVSHEQGLRILKRSKDLGAVTLMGGHNATQLAEQIMTNNNFVDFVIKGDGEKAILEVIEGQNPETIDNLVYRTSEGKTISNKTVGLDLNKLPIVRYEEINFEPYLKFLMASNFDDSNPSHNYQRVYSHKGCGNRNSTSGCIFCGRADFGVRFKSPQRYLDELSFLQNTLGADYVFDVGDDILANVNWLKELVKTKNERYSDINLRMGCFGRANRVNELSASLLRQLGVVEVVIGFESGDREVMDRLSKGATPETNLFAAECLYAQGIDVCASYVLGLPGENEQSLNNTLENARKINQLSRKYIDKPPREIDANLIEPHPGSPAFKAISNNVPSYRTRDKFDLEELQNDYFKLFFNFKNDSEVSNFRKTMIDFAKRINGLAQYTDVMGYKIGELTQR